MDENKPDITQEEPKPIKKSDAPKKAAPVTANQHDSNPFTTTIQGIKKLFSLNMGPLVGVTLFSLVIYGLIFAVGAVMFIGFIGFIYNYAPESFLGLYTDYPEFGDFASSMTDGAIYTMWIVGLAIILLLGSLIQAMQLKLVYASATGTTIEFGETLKQGAKRALPLLGLAALTCLAFVAIIAITVAIVTTMAPLGLLLLALSPAIFIFAIYLSLRLSFAAFAIVAENMGPIDAIKRSWAVTSRHVGEVVGIVAASSLIVAVPVSLVQGIAQNTGGAVGSTLQLAVGVVGLAISTIMMAAAAERFVQLRNIFEGKVAATRTHAMNYLAVLFLIIASAFVSALTPPEVNQEQPGDWQRDLQKYEQEVQDELDGNLKLN